MNVTGMMEAFSFDWTFLSSLLSIILIDLLLAGDNAVVIAMAVRSLPKEQRGKGIIFGSGAAVLLRVALTFFVSQLLLLKFVKLVGGVLILWIALKLFTEGGSQDEGGKEAASITEAIRIIVIADTTMALDNMLAVAGASHGNIYLLLFGLGLSIPFIVFTSNLLSMLMDKHPIIVYVGAAILGRVGGEMILTDPVTQSFFLPGHAVHYLLEAVFAVGVIVVGKMILYKRRSWDAETVEEISQDAVPSGADLSERESR